MNKEEKTKKHKEWLQNKLNKMTNEERNLYYKNEYQRTKKYKTLEYKKKMKEYQYNWYLKNKKHHNEKMRISRNRRLKFDINYRILDNLRSRLTAALKKNIKSKSTLELLGCSIDELKQHLQKTAIQNGYLDFDINNYKGSDYHIDHIKPCSKFNLNNELEQKECFNWSNLQILDKNKNLNKSFKEIYE